MVGILLQLSCGIIKLKKFKKMINDILFYKKNFPQAMRPFCQDSIWNFNQHQMSEDFLFLNDFEHPEYMSGE